MSILTSKNGPQDDSKIKMDKFGKIEHKINLLQQTKIQNLNQSHSNKLEDRLNQLENKTLEHIKQAEKISLIILI